MGWLCFLFVVAVSVPAIVKQLNEAAKKKELERLKNEKPDLWLQMKQMEHEQRQMEHQRGLMRHDSMKTGASLGAFILRLLLKK